MKTSIFLAKTLCFVLSFCGLMAMAEPSKAPKVKKGDKAQESALKKSAMSGPLEVPAETPASTEEKGANQLRNGFFELYLLGVSPFPLDSVAFSVNYSIGGIFKNWNYMEGGGAVNFGFGGSGDVGEGDFDLSSWTVKINYSHEFNFIKNDGLNHFIPGIALDLEYLYLAIKTKDRAFNHHHNFGLGLSVFYKMFISKRFALIPKVGTAYYTSAEKFALLASFSVRRYF